MSWFLVCLMGFSLWRCWFIVCLLGFYLLRWCFEFWAIEKLSYLKSATAFVVSGALGLVLAVANAGAGGVENEALNVLGGFGVYCLSLAGFVYFFLPKRNVKILAKIMTAYILLFGVVLGGALAW